MSKSSTSWFERIVRVLPRSELEALSGMDRPWQADRKHLEKRVISLDSTELREELSCTVRRGLLP